MSQVPSRAPDAVIDGPVIDRLNRRTADLIAGLRRVIYQ